MHSSEALDGAQELPAHYRSPCSLPFKGPFQPTLFHDSMTSSMNLELNSASKESKNRFPTFFSGIGLATCNQKHQLHLSSEPQPEQTGLGCEMGVSGTLTYSNMCFQNHTDIICTVPYREGYRASFCVLHHSHNLEDLKKKTAAEPKIQFKSLQSPSHCSPQDKQSGFYSSSVTPGELRLIKALFTCFAVTTRAEAPSSCAGLKDSI